MKAMSLIQILVTLFLGSLVLVGGSLLLRSLKKQEIKSQSKAELENSFLNLSNHLTRVGRMASSCNKVSASTLECMMNFSGLPSDPLTAVRFIYVAMDRALNYSVFENSSWSTKITYPNISEVIFCDEADMSSNNCNLQPLKISTVGVGNSNRFFRYKITLSFSPPPSSNVMPVVPIIYQSSFFVRNPTSVASLYYQWPKQNQIE